MKLFLVCSEIKFNSHKHLYRQIDQPMSHLKYTPPKLKEKLNKKTFEYTWMQKMPTQWMDMLRH